MTSTATQCRPKIKKTRNRRPWTPDDSDREIFEYVRMGGQTQAEVALRLGISQSTVSRVVCATSGGRPGLSRGRPAGWSMASGCGPSGC